MSNMPLNMHRSYQSVLPATNKLLQQRWDQTYYDEHMRRVRDIVPVVDTKPPQTYMHLHLKLKKLQLEEERLATIERDNRILLEKMSYTMRTRGRIDNRNNYEYQSLNREKRQRELLRVTTENQSILRRIQARKPEYDHLEWEADWQDKLKFMDSISAYPQDWWKKDGSSTSRAASEAKSRRSSETARKQEEETTEKEDTGNEKPEEQQEEKQEEQKELEEA